MELIHRDGHEPLRFAVRAEDSRSVEQGKRPGAACPEGPQPAQLERAAVQTQREPAGWMSKPAGTHRVDDGAVDTDDYRIAEETAAAVNFDDVLAVERHLPSDVQPGHDFIIMRDL